MTVEKDGKIFEVRENKKSWTVRRVVDILTINYNISKSDCATFKDLESYIKTDDVF